MMRKSGLDSAMMIQKAAEQHLMSLIPKVCESDLEVAELERQVRELKDKIMGQRLIRKMKMNGESYERTSKANRENCFSEKIDSSTKDEMKISDDMRLQKEQIPSCVCHLKIWNLSIEYFKSVTHFSIYGFFNPF